MAEWGKEDIFHSSSKKQFRENWHFERERETGEATDKEMKDRETEKHIKTVLTLFVGITLSLLVVAFKLLGTNN